MTAGKRFDFSLNLEPPGPEALAVLWKVRWWVDRHYPDRCSAGRDDLTVRLNEEVSWGQGLKLFQQTYEVFTKEAKLAGFPMQVPMTWDDLVRNHLKISLGTWSRLLSRESMYQAVKTEDDGKYSWSIELMPGQRFMWVGHKLWDLYEFTAGNMPDELAAEVLRTV